MAEDMTRRAQEERAKRLRSRIQAVVDQSEGEACDRPVSSPTKESPREFVHRRMSEISRQSGRK